LDSLSLPLPAALLGRDEHGDDAERLVTETVKCECATRGDKVPLPINRANEVEGRESQRACARTNDVDTTLDLLEKAPAVESKDQLLTCGSRSGHSLHEGPIVGESKGSDVLAVKLRQELSSKAASSAASVGGEIAGLSFDRQVEWPR
jgi:hypothetical protein